MAQLRLDLFPEEAAGRRDRTTAQRLSRDGRTVIGCVWGAWRALGEQMRQQDQPEPGYEWCEEQWKSELRKVAPRDNALPEWLRQELWWRWRAKMRDENRWAT